MTILDSGFAICGTVFKKKKKNTKKKITELFLGIVMYDSTNHKFL